LGFLLKDLLPVLHTEILTLGMSPKIAYGEKGFSEYEAYK